METLHTIFGFVGPSGCGKTTLILELIKRFPHVRVVKSTSTRPRRDDIDDIFYDLVSEEEFKHKIQNNELINYHQYAGYWYGTNLHDTEKVLENNCGGFALVENSVADIRAKSIPLKLIKINPEKDGELIRADHRKKADEARAAIQLDFDLIINNSFRPGGLEKSLQILCDFVQHQVQNHSVDMATAKS